MKHITLCDVEILNKFNDKIKTTGIISVLCLLCTLEHKTMILNIITFILIIVKLTRCSIVNDELNQEATYVTKYCPRQKYCREGSHVVCLYYDHNHLFGPLCGNPVNVHVTPKMVQTILANVNDIRGKVATGTEKGKDDEILPRAYGLMKLEWDKELAFLAQVLANQCLGGREDPCRSTDLFPDPSQTIAIIRYKYPDWEYLKPNNTEKGLNEEKLIFSIDRFFKSMNALKKKVSKAIIKSCPRFRELPDVNSKYYLNLIRGGATHIGCGISAYSKYRMDRDTESIQNSVQIVCNISDAPKPRQSVYKIVPPVPGKGYTKRCGCPRGYKESRSCLCERETKLLSKARDAAQSKPKHNSIQPTKNLKKKKGGPQLKNQLVKDSNQDSSKGINHRPHNDGRNDKVKLAAQSQPKLPVIHSSPENKDGQANGIKPPLIPLKSRHIIESKGNNSEENHSKEKQMDNIESSDEFSRIANAIAPENNHIETRITDEKNDLVINFSSETMSSKPQDQKQALKPANAANIFEDLIFKVRSLKTYGEKESTTESALHVVKENLVDNYRNSKQNHVVSNEKTFQVRAQNKHSDFKHKKLLAILNSLEREVNNITFDDDLKKIFDIKMRKIYETGVNKSQETLSSRKLDEQQNKKDWNDLRHFLDNENNARVEDQIVALRRMLHRLSTGTQNDHKLTYAENENSPNQKYNYVDQQFDEYHETKYVNDMDNLYEDIPSITTLAEQRDFLDKLKEIMNSKHNVDRQYDDNIDLRDNSKTRNQETFANNNARQTILSTAIDYNLDHYDNEQVKLEQRAMNKIMNSRQQVERNNKQMITDRKGRNLDMNKNVQSSERRTNTFSEERLQFSHPLSRRYPGDDFHQIRLRRPNLLGMLRLSRNQPRPSIF